MSRAPLHVAVRLASLRCHAGADLAGASEPYLWVTYFKVDGESVTVTDVDAMVFSGVATVEGRAGSHGNLGVDGMRAGDEVAVPEALGAWETTLAPIAVQTSAREDGGPDDVAGGVGVFCVVREGDEADDARVEANRAALARRVQDVLDELVASRGPERPGFTEDEVRDALEAGWEDVAREGDSWVVNPDDTVGAKVWFFPHDWLAHQGVARLVATWEGAGRWSLAGTVTARPLDPGHEA